MITVFAVALVSSGGQLCTCLGAAGDPDASFGGTGRVKLGMGGGFAAGYAAAVQSDGKIIVAGYSSPKGTTAFGEQFGGDFLLARFDTNNALDTTFGNNGVVVTQVSTNYPNYQSSQINALVIQPDGKIVAGGYSFQKTNYSSATLVRYNTNGTVDPGFGTNGTGIVFTDWGWKSQINGLALQFGTNIIAVGYVGNDSGVPFSFMHTIYSSSGILQGGLGDGFGKYIEADAVVTEGDGSLLIAGVGLDTNNLANFVLAHYTAGGRSMGISKAGDLHLPRFPEGFPRTTILGLR